MLLEEGTKKTPLLKTAIILNGDSIQTTFNLDTKSNISPFFVGILRETARYFVPTFKECSRWS